MGLSFPSSIEAGIDEGFLRYFTPGEIGYRSSPIKELFPVHGRFVKLWDVFLRYEKTRLVSGTLRKWCRLQLFFAMLWKQMHYGLPELFHFWAVLFREFWLIETEQLSGCYTLQECQRCGNDR
jgi:hypothetical protein